MTTRILDLTAVANDNPFLPSDTVQGSFFTKVSGADAEVFTGEIYGTDTVWRCDDVLPNAFTVDLFLPQINFNSRGPVFVNSAGNGIGFLIRDSDVRVFEYAGNVLTGGALATYSATVVSNDTITVEANQSAGAYGIKQNGTLIATYSQPGLSSLFAGFTLRGGTFRTFTLTYTSGVAINTSPADIRVTESRTVRITALGTSLTTGNVDVYVNANTNAAITPSAVTLISGNTYDVVFTVTDAYAGLKYDLTGYPVIISTPDGDATSGNIPYLPRDGYDFVNPTSVPGDVVVISGTLDTTDQAEWDTVGGTVEVNNDLTFTFTGEDPDGVTFDLRIWDSSDSTWGDFATQTFTTDAVTPVGNGSANDLKQEVLGLLGYAGALPDRELRWYLANGATIAQLNDAKKQFIIARGITFKSMNDSWKEYLVSLGYSGALSDMEKQFWSDGGPP